jgi:uncharacterized protein YndB with AHSA1/START domain
MPTAQAEPQTSKLQLRRTIAAPRQKVFRAWTDPEAVKAWWSPPDHDTLGIEIDLRVGGHYRFTMRKRPDGEPFSVYGTFQEVHSPERVVYTWRWDWADKSEMLVTVEFHDLGKQTEMVLTHERFPSAELREEHSKGWNGCFDRVEQYVRS